MKKKHSDSAESVNKLISLEDNRPVAWISKNSRYILGLLAAAIVLIILIFRWSALNVSKAEDAYTRAQNAFNAWQKSLGSEEKGGNADFLALSNYLETYPNLQAKYDGTIAQTLLALGEEAKALPFARRTLQRVQLDKLPLYRDFSENTLLIGEGKVEQALEKSQQLQNKMDEEKSSPLLAEFNLLRTGMLDKALGNREGELALWHLWQNDFLKKSALNSSVNFGKITIAQYIQEREKALTAK